MTPIGTGNGKDQKQVQGFALLRMTSFRVLIQDKLSGFDSIDDKRCTLLDSMIWLVLVIR